MTTSAWLRRILLYGFQHRRLVGHGQHCGGLRCRMYFKYGWFDCYEKAELKERVVLFAALLHLLCLGSAILALVIGTLLDCLV